MSLELIFPRLQTESYEIISPKALDYNCIAWAANEHSRWWWPDPSGDYYWPDGVPREETVPAFREAFERFGYIPCSSHDFESGFEKVAIFAGQSGAPTHMARQLNTGRWTSKLGEIEDIEHSLQSLESPDYGSVVMVLRRPVLNC